MIERVNLVPQPPLAARIKKRTPLVCGLLLLLGCLVVFFMAKRLSDTNRYLADEIARLELQKAAQQGQQDAIVQLSREIEQLAEKEKQLRRNVAGLMLIPKNKPLYSEVFLHLGKSLPATVRCEKISLNERGGEISGTATMYRDLPGFVEKIRQVHRFHSVVLQVVHQLDKEDSDLLAFNITFGLREVHSL